MRKRATAIIPAEVGGRGLTSGGVAQEFRSWLLAVYIVCLPLSMLTVDSVGSALRIMAGTLTALGILDIIGSKRPVRAFGVAEVAWVTYVLYMSLSLLWDAGKAGTSTVLGMVQLTALAMVLTRINFTPRICELLDRAWLVTGSVCTLLITLSSGRIQYVERAIVLLPGGASDANEFCAYFIMPMAIIADRLVTSRSLLARLLFATLGAVFSYSVVSTGSRGGLLACSAAFMISLVLAVKRRGLSVMLRILPALAIVLACVASLGIFQLLPEGVLARLSLEALANDGGSGRDVIWRESWDLMFRQGGRFFFGFGPFGNDLTGPTMHNQFLQSFVDGGLIGLALFLWLSFALLRRSRVPGHFFAALIGSYVDIFTLSASASFKPIWAIFMMSLLPESGPPVPSIGDGPSISRRPWRPRPARLP